uniref:Uncharacterized protein n=1 Tax=Parascaris equorum TaxID=6256 RepID=A0A914S2T8_PAREQ
MAKHPMMDAILNACSWSIAAFVLHKVYADEEAWQLWPQTSFHLSRIASSRPAPPDDLPAALRSSTNS